MIKQITRAFWQFNKRMKEKKPKKKRTSRKEEKREVEFYF